MRSWCIGACIVTSISCGRLGYDAKEDGEDGGEVTATLTTATLFRGDDDVAWGHLAVDDAGNVYLHGQIRGSADIGGGMITAAGNTDILSASYTADLAHRWSLVIGAGSTDNALAISVRGPVAYLLGQFEGSIDVGTEMFSAMGGDDQLLVEVSGDGSVIEARQFSGSGDDDFGGGVSSVVSGEVVVAVSCSGTIDLGAGPIAGLGGRDVCFARYAAAGGGLLASRRYGGPGFDVPRAVVVRADASICIAGLYVDDADFGTGPQSARGGTDVFVLCTDPEGAPLWLTTFGSSADESVQGMAVAADGTVYVAGYLGGESDLPGGIGGFGDVDGYIAAFAGDDGAHRWSYAFGGSGADIVNGVHVDAQGRIYVAGEFELDSEFAGRQLSAIAGKDAFAGSLDSSGQWRWLESYESTGSAAGEGIHGRDGNVWLSGHTTGTIDFGAGPLTITGARAGFLVQLNEQ